MSEQQDEDNILEKGVAGAKDAAMALFGMAEQAVDSALSQFRDTRDKVESQVISLLDEFKKIEPMIDEAGFTIDETSITLGVPPAVSFIINKEKANLKKLAQLDKEKKNLSPMQKAMVAAIVRAAYFSERVTKSGYNIKSFEAELTLPPKVKLRLL